VTTLRMSSIFAESAHRLPKETRAKLPKVFMLLTSNPRHPSLRLKKIQGATRPNVYECRIDRSWRLILQGMGKMTFDLVYAGAHDEAISYGARLREGRLPYGSSASIVERLEAYLAGDDQALEFVALTSDDLEKFGG
jgi:mRNA interferase RelE/StbE